MYQMQAQENPKVGLVLSGGGAKGYAHIAVLKQLEKSGVRIDYIGGTSMGAIVGSLYASGYSADQLDSLVRKSSLNDLIFNYKNRKSKPLFDKTYNEKYILDIPFNKFKPKLPSAISNGEAPYLFLSELLLDSHSTHDFSQLPIPFYCVATNLETGEEKIFNAGFLPKCVMASASLPSLLKPVTIDEDLYVDGGVTNNFPVLEMRRKGMDIVIGVDLGQALKKKDKLNNIADIMTQISNFSIKEEVQQQKKYLDVYINPDLEEYSTTSFEDYDSIYARGKRKAQSFEFIFNKIAEKQRVNKSIKEEKEENESYCILDINIHGSDKFNRDYVKGKLGVHENESLSPKDITKGMNRLIQTKNYEEAYYEVQETEGGYNLNINVKEKKINTMARIGVHYDNIYRSALLLNLSTRNFIFNNTSASFDFILGDRIRYYFNVFGDNGIKPSIGFQSRYMNAPIKISQNATNTDFNYINYDFNWLHNSLYVQSTFKDKYALIIGIDHDYANVKTDVLSRNNPNRKLSDSYYISPKAELRADTQDNRNYPTSGLLLYGLAKYAAWSNQNEFISNLQLSGSIQYSQTIWNKITVQPYAYIGIQGKNNSFIFNNILGGMNKQNMLYFQPFIGYNYASIFTKNVIKIAGSIQIEIFKNNYISLIANAANAEDEIDLLRFFKYKYSGIGINYGFDSPIGPINLNYGYSSQLKENLVNFSLGYWF